jgi:hypothetical protein
MSLRRTGGFLVVSGWQLLADPASQATRSAWNRAWPSAWSGMDGVSRQRQPSPSPRVGGVSRCVWRGRPGGARRGWCAGRPTGGTLGAAGDRPGAGGGLAGAAFPAPPDDYVGAQGGVLLVASDPLVKLCRRPRPCRERLRVEGHKHRVQQRSGRLPGALAGSGDGPLADGFRVEGGHAQAVAGEGFAQRRPGGAQLAGGGVDAAELFGQRVGPLSFGPIGEEPAGLPAQLPVNRVVAHADAVWVADSGRGSRPGGCSPAAGARSPGWRARCPGPSCSPSPLTRAGRPTRSAGRRPGGVTPRR